MSFEDSKGRLQQFAPRRAPCGAGDTTLIASKDQAVTLLLQELSRAGLTQEIRALNEASQPGAAFLPELLSSLLHVLRGQIQSLDDATELTDSKINFEARHTRVQRLDAHICMLDAIKAVAHFTAQVGQLAIEADFEG